MQAESGMVLLGCHCQRGRHRYGQQIPLFGMMFHHAGLSRGFVFASASALDVGYGNVTAALHDRSWPHWRFSPRNSLEVFFRASCGRLKKTRKL